VSTAAAAAAAAERCQRPRAVRPPLIWPRSIVPQVPLEFVPARRTPPSGHNTPPAASSISETAIIVIIRHVHVYPSIVEIKGESVSRLLRLNWSTIVA
jgi:hypothetical protein